MAATVVFSCGNKNTADNKQDNATDTVATAQPAQEDDGGKLSIDSVKFQNETGRTRVDIKVEYPTTGSETAKNVLCEYISEQLGGTYKGDVTDVDAMAKYYGNQAFASLQKERKECGDAADVGYENDYYITKTYEGKGYVTFTSQQYIYTGGAHGSTVSASTTFRKSDGRRFGTDMLRNTASDGFFKLLKEGLRQYFKEMGENFNDEQMQEQIITDAVVDALPLPVTPPCLSDKGVVFIYQQYELLCYAAGMPCFTIPYSKMRPYLTQTVLNMVDAK